jgi:CYTH domain-containing protein
MAKEIERKFLVIGDGWRQNARATRYRQGYIVAGGGRTVRIRTSGRAAFLTIKGPRTGLSRDEFEYAIPVKDARAMLDTLCVGGLIEKVRHEVEAGGLVWEIDEFEGDNAGLLLAEVELEREDQVVKLPAWVGREVTADRRYYNSYLTRRPYRTWGRHYKK